MLKARSPRLFLLSKNRQLNRSPSAPPPLLLRSCTSRPKFVPLPTLKCVPPTTGSLRDFSGRTRKNLLFHLIPI